MTKLLFIILNNSGRLEPAASGGETEEAAGARAQTPAVRAAQGTGEYCFLNSELRIRVRVMLPAQLFIPWTRVFFF